MAIATVARCALAMAPTRNCRWISWANCSMGSMCRRTSGALLRWLALYPASHQLAGARTGRGGDEGIWEVRGGRRAFVHSRVMCWVAFDRAHPYAERPEPACPPGEWRAMRDTIYQEIMEQGLERGKAELCAVLWRRCRRCQRLVDLARPALRLRPIRACVKTHRSHSAGTDARTARLPLSGGAGRR